jgi:hypothetical protein
VIRLRQSLEAGLRHPLLGPVLLICLGLILAFVIFHTVEHGVEGLLFTCAIVAAVVLRLVVVQGRIWRVTPTSAQLTGRAPPPAVTLPAIRPPTLLFALPLRR